MTLAVAMRERDMLTAGRAVPVAERAEAAMHASAKRVTRAMHGFRCDREAARASSRAISCAAFAHMPIFVG